MKVNEVRKLALKYLKNINNNEFEVNLFIRDFFGLSLTDICFNKEIECSQEEIDKFIGLLNMRDSGCPYNYIFKYKKFYNRRFYVDERVLIPRPETELLVEECINYYKGKTIDRYLDLCTGSGCIGISLASELDIKSVTLADISKDSLEVAKKNAYIYNIDAYFIESDLFSKIVGEFDLITINPPYVPLNRKRILDKTVIDYEPNLALFADNDGLSIIKKFIQEYDKYLTDDGLVLMEFDESQGDAISKLLEEKKVNFKIYKDYSNMDRFVVMGGK